MKIRKSLIVLCYVVLLAVCLWILDQIRLPGQDSRSSTEAAPAEEKINSGNGLGNTEQFLNEQEAVIRYIFCRKCVSELTEKIWRVREQEEREKVHQRWLWEQEEREKAHQRWLWEQEAWEKAHQRWLWEQERTDKEAGKTEPPYVPPKIMIASDLHFMSDTTHDDGAAFRKMVAEDDGKVSRYSDVIVDALLEEALKEQVSALVLAGDNTLNGERINQEELAGKLQKLVDAGIPVLIIPGNHDIQNHDAATYFGDRKEEAQYLETAEDFLEIFHPFGYDQARSRDPASLSYVYALDEKHWMMMLDSCQYEDGNQVSGRIRGETLAWMREQLEQAQAQQVSVVPVAHHNLLSESRLYTTHCTMENHEEVLALLEEFELPLSFSGHLHAQRIKKHKAEPGVSEDAYGITEIVMGPFSIPPCQYGSLSWDMDGGMAFELHTLDSFDRFLGQGKEFVKEIRKNQVKKTLYSVPEDLKEQMACLYADLYYDYCAGNRIIWDEVRTTKAFRLWERLCPDSTYMTEMRHMAEDVAAYQNVRNLTLTSDAGNSMIKITGR